MEYANLKKVNELLSYHNVIFTNISVHKIPDNTVRITESAKSVTKVFV
jgi:transcriptional/translational regulatory protein YebC/TACO1